MEEGLTPSQIDLSLPCSAHDQCNCLWCSGHADQDFHAHALKVLAAMLGVGHWSYYPLIGAANKLKMYREGKAYEEAKEKEG